MQETPKGVAYTETVDMAGIQTWNPVMAASIDELLPWRWDDAATMNATVGTQAGDLGYRTDEGGRVYTWTGTAWTPVKFRSEDVYGSDLNIGSNITAGRYVTVGGLGSGNTPEPGFILKRSYGGTDKEIKIYSSASATSNASIQVRTNNKNMSRLITTDAGEISMQTYADSPTVTAVRPVPFATAGGFLELSGAANTTRSVVITYPANRFTQRPNVQISMRSTNPQNGSVSYDHDTETSVTLFLRYSTSTAIPVSWLATQMTATATSG